MPFSSTDLSRGLPPGLPDAAKHGSAPEQAIDASSERSQAGTIEGLSEHLDADVHQAGQAADARHEFAGAHAAAARHGVCIHFHAPVFGRHRVDDGVAPEARHVEQVLRRLRQAYISTNVGRQHRIANVTRICMLPHVGPL